MSLIKCAGCGKIISDRATVCPKCGHMLTQNDNYNVPNDIECKKEIYRAFLECDYYKMCEIYSKQSSAESLLDCALYPYALLFNGEEDKAVQSCVGFMELCKENGIDITVNQNQAEQYAKAVDASKIASEKISSISDNVYMFVTFVLIYATAGNEWHKKIGSYSRFLNRGCIVNVSENAALQKFYDICNKRNHIISDNPSETEIDAWCRENGLISEEIAFSTAEYFFIYKKSYEISAKFYYLAAEKNPNDPKYWGYYAQSLLKNNNIFSGDLYKAYKAIDIAIALQPENPKWHIFMANILNRIQISTLFNVDKLILKKLDTAEGFPNVEKGDDSAITTLRAKYGR